MHAAEGRMLNNFRFNPIAMSDIGAFAYICNVGDCVVSCDLKEASVPALNQCF